MAGWSDYESSYSVTFATSSGLEGAPVALVKSLLDALTQRRQFAGLSALDNWTSFIGKPFKYLKTYIENAINETGAYFADPESLTSSPYTLDDLNLTYLKNKLLTTQQKNDLFKDGSPLSATWIKFCHDSINLMSIFFTRNDLIPGGTWTNPYAPPRNNSAEGFSILSEELAETGYIADWSPGVSVTPSFYVQRDPFRPSTRVYTSGWSTYYPGSGNTSYSCYGYITWNDAEYYIYTPTTDQNLFSRTDRIYALYSKSAGADSEFGTGPLDNFENHFSSYGEDELELFATYTGVTSTQIVPFKTDIIDRVQMSSTPPDIIAFDGNDRDDITYGVYAIPYVLMEVSDFDFQ